MDMMAATIAFMCKGCKMFNKDSVSTIKIDFYVVQGVFRKINDHNDSGIIMLPFETQNMVIHTVSQLNKVGSS
jgi:hypothetical protein